MRRAPLAILLVAALTTTGCLGSIDPARIPQATLDDHSWAEANEDRASVAGGLGERVILTYEPAGGPYAGVAVISANDVPIFDESQLLPRLIEKVEERQNVQLEENGSRQLSLTNLDTSVQATVYDVKGAPADAQAVLFTAPCSAFAAVLAYGTTESRDGGGGLPTPGGDLLGQESSSQDDDGSTAYDEAVTVAQDVTCT